MNRTAEASGKRAVAVITLPNFLLRFFLLFTLISEMASQATIETLVCVSKELII